MARVRGPLRARPAWQRRPVLAGGRGGYRQVRADGPPSRSPPPLPPPPPAPNRYDCRSCTAESIRATPVGPPSCAPPWSASRKTAASPITRAQDISALHLWSRNCSTDGMETDRCTSGCCSRRRARLRKSEHISAPGRPRLVKIHGCTGTGWYLVCAAASIAASAVSPGRRHAPTAPHRG